MPNQPHATMPAFSTISRADLAAAARALYTNARDTPAIVTALTPFGYTATDYDAGLALLDAFQAATASQSAEYADQYAATTAAQIATADLRARYSRHRQVARLAHRRGTDGYGALHLMGTTPPGRADLVRDAATFYDTLAARPDLAAPIRGLDPAALTDAQALVTAARDADAAQTAETGQAQQASVALTAAEADLRALTAAEADLRAHAAELAATAKLALADAPQLRESLGLLER